MSGKILVLELGEHRLEPRRVKPYAGSASKLRGAVLCGIGGFGLLAKLVRLSHTRV